MAKEFNAKHVLIDVIPLTDFTELRVNRVEDEDGNFVAVDIRQWYSTQKDPEKRPTQRGVFVKSEFIDNVIDALATTKK